MLALRGVWAQAPAPAPAVAVQPERPASIRPSPGPTEAEIVALQERIRADASLDGPTRDAALASAGRALEAVRATTGGRTATAQLARDTSDAPQRIEELRTRLAQPPRPIELESVEGKGLEEIERLRAAAKAEADAARAEVERLADEPARRLARLDELTAAVPVRRQAIEAAIALAKEPADASAPALLAEATRLERLAQAEQAQAALEAAEAEIAALRAREPLLPLRRDWAVREADRAARTLAEWEKLESQARQRQAESAAAEAEQLRRQAAGSAPEVQALAQANADLARERTGERGVVERLRRVREQVQAGEQSLAGLVARGANAMLKVEVAGLSTAIGTMLRRELDRLPDESQLRADRQRARKDMADTQYALIELEEQRRELGDVGAAVERLVSSVDPAKFGTTADDLRAVARELYTKRIEALDALQRERQQLFDELVKADEQLGRTLEATGAFRSFIEERVLWTRSVRGGGLPSVAHTREALAWLTDLEGWKRSLSALWNARKGSRLADGLGALVLALSAALVPAMMSRVRALADPVSRQATDRYRYTALALFLSLAAALPPAGIAWGLSRWIGFGEDDRLRAASAGLGEVALYVLVVGVVRALSNSRGVLVAHFRWAEESARALGRFALLVLLLVPPLLFVHTAMAHQPTDEWSTSLGRAAFMCGSVAFALLYAWLLRPGGAFVGPAIRRRPASILARTRWLWYPAMVTAPIALAGLALAGWYFTAERLDARFHLTLWIVAGLVIVNAMLLRWLYIERRRLAVERARAKRAAEKQAEAQQQAVVEPELNVPEIDAQTRRLIRAAMTLASVVLVLGAWADVLPALRMLERVQVWPELRILADAPGSIGERAAAATTEAGGVQPAESSTEAGAAQAPGAGLGPSGAMMPGGVGSALGGSGEGGGESAEPGVGRGLTLASIGYSVIILVLVHVLTTNVPGLLEIVLLKRLPLDAGARFAITSIVRYIILFVGLLLALSVLGLRWGQVQWLAAALTFGLAFGLQEIFANFVSGLILLIERPVRVGDVVTVGATEGTVTRINMRATTVQDFDRREMVIPNKTFITSNFLNWSLTDATVRLIVPVGVAYGSDVERVRRILREIAESRDYVLTNPPPFVLLAGFADSSLGFELRVFLKHLDYLVTARDELHRMIEARFRDEGVEIAFPQIDLHVRDLPPSGQGAGSGSASASPSGRAQDRKGQ